MKVLNESERENVLNECTFRNTFPVPNNCREKNVEYKAEVNGSIYIGMKSNKIRSRIKVKAHRHLFRTKTK